MTVMKKLSLFLIVIFLITICSSFQQVNAQEKTKAEQEKEKKIQQEIDLQKRAISEANQALKEQQSELEKTMENVRVEVKSSGNAGGTVRMFTPRGNRSFSMDEPFMISTPGADTFYSHSGGGDSERTTWDFSKSVKENTFSKEYSFDVEKTVKTVVMSVMGDCKAGEIRIKIVMPGGKSYSDIVIDESGNLNWRKSFNISETENQDKTGEWKFKIDSNKATGFFKISLQTY
jgi:hypothetical protein